MTLRGVLVAVQALTFVGLAVVLLRSGEWKLGAAQLLLGAVTVLIYY